MSLKSLYGRIEFEAQIHSHHSECKNEQKSVLTNVNRQRNALPHFQMFPDFGDASPCSCVRLLVLFLLFVEDGLDVEERFNQQMFFSEE